MKVVCIYEYKVNKFTYGKIYEVYESSTGYNRGDGYYGLVDDYGKLNYMLCKNFMLLSEYRDGLICNILENV